MAEPRGRHVRRRNDGSSRLDDRVDSAGCKQGSKDKTGGERPAVVITVAPVETREIQRVVEVVGTFPVWKRPPLRPRSKAASSKSTTT